MTTLTTVKQLRGILEHSSVRCDVPQPNIPATPTALIIAQGTAVRALAASSLICTEASKAPMVHNGAKKLSVKANPSGHP